MTHVMIRTQSQHVNTSLQPLFHKLAMAHNWEVLQLLTRASCSVQYIASALELAESDISKSLHQLRDLGFVTFRKVWKFHLYSLAKGLFLSTRDGGVLQLRVQWEVNTTILIEFDPPNLDSGW